jgi:hypothetical protein
VDNALPFTFVNPTPETKLSHRDRVFVLTSKIDKELESQEFKGSVNIHRPIFNGSVNEQLETMEGRSPIFNQGFQSYKEFRTKSINKSYIKQSKGDYGLMERWNEDFG